MTYADKTLSVSQLLNNDPRRRLVAQLKACPPNEAATLLISAETSLAFEALTELNPLFTQDILSALPDERRQAIVNSATPELMRQWERNRSFEAGTIRRFLEPTYAMFRPQMTMNEAIEKLRVLVKTAFTTYGYVTDPDQKLLGLVTMRDLLFAEREAQFAPEPLQKLHFKVESAIQ